MDLASTLRRWAPLSDCSEDAEAVPHSREVERSVAYLSSSAALESLEADSYWPKWDAPWWHMLLLHEQGQSALIPVEAAHALVAALNRLPLKIFPTQPSDVPEGLDPFRDASCHCAIGCIIPVLLSAGVDIDASLPWTRTWFPRYQMADGGLSCDPDAYLPRHEVDSSMASSIASSMVGTVSPMEAMLTLSQRQGADPLRPEEVAFVDRGAAFLVGRGLTRGSESVHNAEERQAAPAWRALTFPRFYFYDVLRGLSVLVAWANGLRRPLPWSAIATVVEELTTRFPDGRVRIERNAWEGRMTKWRGADGAWSLRVPATRFPLLDASSTIGAVSPFLSKQWRTTREGIAALAAAGLLVET